MKPFQINVLLKLMFYGVLWNYFFFAQIISFSHKSFKDGFSSTNRKTNQSTIFLLKIFFVYVLPQTVKQKKYYRILFVTNKSI